VGGKETCTFCGNYMIKHGKSSANKIRFKCKKCNRTRVDNYPQLRKVSWLWGTI